MMKYELEREIKNLLTKQEFLRLKKFFHFSDDDFQPQTNYYFETENQDLKKLQAALRIRQKNEKFVLTLKQKRKDDVHEYHLNLSSQEAKALLQKQNTKKIKEILHAIGAESLNPHYLGSLTTLRAQCLFMEGMIFLDKSSYFQQTDYEIEYEVKNWAEGKQAFYHLMQEHEIHLKPTLSKIARFYTYYLKQA